MIEVWLNGRFLPAGETRVPTLTGPDDGLFETLLVRNGAPELLEAHLDRLIASATTLGRLDPPDRGALTTACRALPGRLGTPRGRMRIAAVAGRTAVTLEPFEGYPPAYYRHGAAAVLADEPGHPLGERAGHKVLPYGPLLAARERAAGQGAIDVLFHAVDDGALLEGSASNLFVVRDGELETPPLGRRILPGVVRGAVLAAARSLGITVRETDVFARDLPRVDEAFLTGSLMEVVPLRQIGGVEMQPGPIARQLLASIRG
jgi:branched-subunit amino acid aminotransferase/4-amino-4-deoxychorismate lyase